MKATSITPRKVHISLAFPLHKALSADKALNYSDRHKAGAAWFFEKGNLKRGILQTVKSSAYKGAAIASQWNKPADFILGQGGQYPFTRHYLKILDPTRSSPHPAISFKALGLVGTVLHDVAYILPIIPYLAGAIVGLPFGLLRALPNAVVQQKTSAKAKICRTMASFGYPAALITHHVGLISTFVAMEIVRLGSAAVKGAMFAIGGILGAAIGLVVGLKSAATAESYEPTSSAADKELSSDGIEPMQTTNATEVEDLQEASQPVASSPIEESKAA